MKKYVSYLFFICPFLLQAQIITTDWNKISFDSTMKKQQMQGFLYSGTGQSVYPFGLLSDKEGDIYVLNQKVGNWQVEKLSAAGKSIWKTSRNYTTPMLDSLQYFASDFFMNNDNSVEVLGTELYVQYPFEGLFLLGAAAKAVYDTKTGKEKAYYSVGYKDGGAEIWNRGSFQRFLKKKDGYFIMDPLPYKGYYGLLRKLKNNLTKVDTIQTYLGDAKSENKTVQSQLRPYMINNRIYYTAGLYKGATIYDSTKFYYRWFKLDTLGNILKQKDINKETYGFFGWFNNTQVKDGFLWSGIADTTYLNNNNPEYQFYVTKVDTNMNIQWRTCLPRKSKDYQNSIRTLELQDDKGYLVFESDESSSTDTWLYHINTKGKVRSLGILKLNNTSQNFFPSCVMQSTNKDIVFGYGLIDCWINAASNGKNPCGGTAMIKYSQLENLITSSKDVSDFSGSESYTIYPNPSKEVVNVRFTEAQKGNLTLFDVQGEAILNQAQTTSADTWQLRLPNIHTGIYFLQITLENGEIRTEKIEVFE